MHPTPPKFCALHAYSAEKQQSAHLDEADVALAGHDCSLAQATTTATATAIDGKTMTLQKKDGGDGGMAVPRDPDGARAKVVARPPREAGAPASGSLPLANCTRSQRSLPPNSPSSPPLARPSTWSCTTHLRKVRRGRESETRTDLDRNGTYSRLPPRPGEGDGDSDRD